MTELSGPSETSFAQARKLRCRFLDRQSRGRNPTFEDLDGCKIRSGAEPLQGKKAVFLLPYRALVNRTGIAGGYLV